MPDDATPDLTQDEVDALLRRHEDKAYEVWSNSYRDEDTFAQEDEQRQRDYDEDHYGPQRHYPKCYPPIEE